MKEISLPDGRKFSWRERGNGKTLVLLHGWGSSSAVFSDLMTHLPDHHTLAPDLPGYGASSPAARVDLDDLCADVIAWCDLLGLKTVTLLGWSLGGIIAQQLAVRFPQRMERLILVATTPCFVTTLDWPHGLADTTVRALARDFKRAPLPTLEKFAAMQFQGERTLPPTLLPTVELTTALGGLELLRHIDLRQQLTTITLPTLVLHGSLDVIVPIGAGRYLAATLPQARFHEISNCGHAPFRSDVVQVSAALRHFLS